MKYMWLLVGATCLVILPVDARAQLSFETAVKKIDGRIEPAEAKPGQTVVFKLEIQLNEGWYTYPTVQPEDSIKSVTNRFTRPPPGDVIFVGPIEDPPGYHSDAIPELMVAEKRSYHDRVTWEFPAVVSLKAMPGSKKVTVDTRVLVCIKELKPDGKFSEKCLAPKKVSVDASLNILDGPPVAIDPKYAQAVESALNPPKVEPKDVSIGKKRDAPPSRSASGSLEPSATFLIPNTSDGYDYRAEMADLKERVSNDLPPPQAESQSNGILGFLLVAIFWGGVTLLTPCVFPMVPITVSFFLKQGEKKGHSPLIMASVYALTIVIVLGLSAIAFLSFFRELSVNPWMNIALGGLFVFFALSLFGMYDIVLPNFLVRFTASKEGQGGYVGTIFMAISFTIVSFTCVAPFLGGFGGLIATNQIGYFKLALGGFAFAATFAAPFFILALFPSLIKKLPKSGGWMNTIKVAMGFMEIAAALKFFRTAELRWQIPTAIFTYDIVLSMWVILLFVMGLYLLNMYRLPHDEPQEHIGVPRMLSGLLSIALGLYLLPGLFAGPNDEKQRPSGTVYAWVDSFLLPEPGKSELNWSSDLNAAIEDARRTNEYVFVDFTGVTCTNCRLNEQSVFPQPEVRRLMKKYHLVSIYTDTIPSRYYETTPDTNQPDDDALANLEFQKSKFHTEQLPLYVILKPETNSTKVKVIGVYDEGKINNVAKFIAFLKKGEVK